ncbi:hypothetical protein [Escherichia coli]|uniref:hypothetical protein n=1 Tax=Escherichia coli TaxID=562 RepID=UPI000CFDEFF7|nr:hypothetical protein [Escherichia coli]
MDYSYCQEEISFNCNNVFDGSYPFETHHGTHIFAMDFDETFNASPLVFSRLVQDLKNNGWTVYFVTSRFITQDNVDIEHWANKLDIGVFYTAGMQKAPFLAQFEIYPDIWMDDSVLSIPAKNQLEFSLKEVDLKVKAKKCGKTFVPKGFPKPDPGEVT